MEQYDLAVLYHPDLEIDLEKATAKVEKLIASVDGTITNTDSWGKRKMAYKIKKQDMAIYVFYSLSLPASGVKKINDTLNITDEVLRFLTLKAYLESTN
ncbi:30S ribosomal protein S6 [bacterium]|nr:30S ribosomal protein S6 [bacterium]